LIRQQQRNPSMHVAPSLEKIPSQVSTKSSLLLFNPLPSPGCCVWETVECGEKGRRKSGWSGLRPGETGQPVQTSRSRPNNPVRSLETGWIRRGKPTTIDPNVHVTRFVIILNYTPGSSFQTDSRKPLSCQNISCENFNLRLFESSMNVSNV